MHEAIPYVLSLPVSTVIVGRDDLAQLEENVKIAARSPRCPRRSWPPSPRRWPLSKQALFFAYEPSTKEGPPVNSDE